MLFLYFCYFSYMRHNILFNVFLSLHLVYVNLGFTEPLAWHNEKMHCEYYAKSLVQSLLWALFQGLGLTLGVSSIKKDEFVNKKYKFPIFIGINGRMVNYSSGLLGVIVRITFHFIHVIPLLPLKKKKGLSWSSQERNESFWASLRSS